MKIKKFIESFKNIYHHLTYSLGRRRRFFRRIGGICLVILGVHAASDLLDNAAFALINTLDGWVDSLVMNFFDWLGSFSWISPAKTSGYAQAFMNLVSTEEKETVSLAFALGIELLIIFHMAGFAWGIHEDDVTPSGGFRLLKKEMKEGLWPPDLERISVFPSLLAFAFAGIFMAASGIETIVYDWLTLFPPWKYSGNLSAALGLAAALLFLTRYFPLLTFGALNRLEERYKKDSRKEFISGKPGRKKWLRGIFPALIVMPTAIVGLVPGSQIKTLILRLLEGLL